MKLLWYLGDWWSWSFFFLALLVMPVMAQGTWNVFPVIFSLSLMFTLAPDFKKYQLVGLGSKIWNEHRRSLVALCALAAAIGALTVQLWWALPIYAVAAAWAMYRRATPRPVPNPQTDLDGSLAPWPGKPFTAGRSRHGVLRVWRKQSGLYLAGIRRTSRCLVSLASSSGHFQLRCSSQLSTACEYLCANTRCLVEVVLFGPDILPCSA